MLLMLDTNICIYGMKRTPDSDRILRRISGRSYGEIVISSVTASELAFGVENSHPKFRSENLEKLNDWLGLFSVLDYPASAMMDYAKLKLEALKAGHKLGAYDVMIAAHALHVGATLVTNDDNFSGMRGLKTVNWLTD